MNRICLALNILSSYQIRSYLRVTTNYIDNWHLMSHIAYKDFHGQHIAQNFMSIVFDIKSKIANIITDNTTIINFFLNQDFS